MKKFVLFLVFAQFILFISHPVLSQFQPAEVVRSQEKTIVNGKVFYIHTVQKNQTLYSISKAYNVTQEEIKAANPQVDVINLTEGIAIRIPESASRIAVAYPENRQDFHAHKIKKGQTVYSLSKKYDVPEAVIYHYNPWAKEGIKPNQTIWIPRKPEMFDISQTTKGSDLFYYYTAKEKDTLYSIAQSYGVGVADIINANPELRNGLRAGQVLKIPKIDQLPDDFVSQVDTLAAPEQPCAAPAEQVTFKVALMLPFFTNISMEEPKDTLSEEDSYISIHRQQGLRGGNFAEFYEGFMLALDSVKKSGMSVTLHVYDTERDTVKVKKIVRELSLIHPDLIIGPVFSEDVNIVGRFARYEEIQLVSPLSTKPELINSNPNIIQVVPSKPYEGYALANYLKQLNKGRFILVRGTDSLSMKNSWRFKKYLIEHAPMDTMGRPLYFKDYVLKDSLIRVLHKILSKEEENYIVVFSDHEPDVSKLVSRLYLLSDAYPIRLVGMPSWQVWKSIDWIQLHGLQLQLISPFYVDYATLQTRNFLMKSRLKLGYEPYEIKSQGYNFTMLGYDIGFYFLSALKQYGSNFINCINQVEADQLLTRFRFQKIGTGGYLNTNCNIIRYGEDFSVEKKAISSGEPIAPPISIPTPPVTSPDTALPALPIIPPAEK
ncbi:MAG: LysM peptidoglycan-binding domain-containing protein [Bacteroidales bacterium]|nr:LysM peptidoglycan-binding domain-containing protein [Bacteroidales bacterium]